MAFGQLILGHSPVGSQVKKIGEVLSFQVESFASAYKQGFGGLWYTACMSRITTGPQIEVDNRCHGYSIGDKSNEGSGSLIAS